jgi:hypothetical protein
MKFMANSILVVLIMTIFIMVFSNFILFFPWYLTLMYQTYNLSVQAAGENYVSQLMVSDVKNDLLNRPIFNRMGDEDIKLNMNEMELDGVMEPKYLQRGESFTVGIECSFPFEITVGETKFKRSIRVKFEVPTTGLKYYRDLGFE